MSAFPHVRVEGTARERGRAYGEQARERAVERKNADSKASQPEFKIGDRVAVLRPRKVKGVP